MGKIFGRRTASLCLMRFFLTSQFRPWVMKTFGKIWEHFLAFDEDDNVLSGNDVSKATKVRCTHPGCEWERAPNPTRMKSHLRGHQESASTNELEEPTTPETSQPQPKRQMSLSTYLDRKYSASEQEAAEMAQVRVSSPFPLFACLSPGLSSCDVWPPTSPP